MVKIGAKDKKSVTFDLKIKKSSTRQKSGIVLPPTSVPAIYKGREKSFNRGRRVVGLVWGHWQLENLRANPLIRYGHVGHEFTPSTNEPHSHFYLEFNSTLRRNRVIKLLGEAWEYKQGKLLVPGGTWEDNLNYNGKGEDSPFFEWGEPAAVFQGQRTDLAAFRDHFKHQGTVREALELHLTCVAKYPRLMQLCREIYSKPRTQETDLIIYWGHPGVGKTTLAAKKFADEGEVYFKPAGKWWGRYRQQPTVVMNDFQGETSLIEMKNIIDHSPLEVDVKGSHENFTSKRVIVTANLPMEEWWNTDQKGYDENFAALKRRVTEIKFFPPPDIRPCQVCPVDCGWCNKRNPDGTIRSAFRIF